MEPDLTGQELAAGSSHVVFLSMNRSSVGPWSVAANIFTDPPSPKPISMTLNAVISGLPVVSPVPLMIEQARGEKSKATLRISYMRTQEEPPLELDRPGCRFSPLTLTHVEARTQLVPSVAGQLNPPQWDQLTLQLDLDETLSVGEHRFQLFPALKGALSLAPVQATVVVRHPCRPAVDRIFLGELKPGARCEQSVKLIRSGQQPLNVASIVASNEHITAMISDSRGALDVRAVAPEKPGRFEGVVTLKFTDPSVPPAEVAVAGVVKFPPE